MKKQFLNLSVVLSVSVILLGVFATVNTSHALPAWKTRDIQADGVPLLPVPPHKSSSVLVADGVPLPPVPPHKSSRVILTQELGARMA